MPQSIFNKLCHVGWCELNNSKLSITIILGNPRKYLQHFKRYIDICRTDRKAFFSWNGIVWLITVKYELHLRHICLGPSSCQYFCFCAYIFPFTPCVYVLFLLGIYHHLQCVGVCLCVCMCLLSDFVYVLFRDNRVVRRWLPRFPYQEGYEGYETSLTVREQKTNNHQKRV